jgi:hypothetical protein
MYEYTSAMKGHLISMGADITPPLTKEEVDKAFTEHYKRMKETGIGNQD